MMKHTKSYCIQSGPSLAKDKELMNRTQIINMKHVFSDLYNVNLREILRTLGLGIYDSVDSIKSSARSSLASSDKRSNVV